MKYFPSAPLSDLHPGPVLQRNLQINSHSWVVPTPHTLFVPMDGTVLMRITSIPRSMIISIRIYCGSNRHAQFMYDTTGTIYKQSRPCSETFLDRGWKYFAWVGILRVGTGVCVVKKNFTKSEDDFFFSEPVPRSCTPNLHVLKKVVRSLWYQVQIHLFIYSISSVEKFIFKSHNTDIEILAFFSPQSVQTMADQQPSLVNRQLETETGL